MQAISKNAQEHKKRRESERSDGELGGGKMKREWVEGVEHASKTLWQAIRKNQVDGPGKQERKTADTKASRDRKVQNAW